MMHQINYMSLPEMNADIQIYMDRELERVANFAEDFIFGSMFVSLNHPEYGTTHSYKASGFSDAMEYLKSVEWNPAWYHYWMLDIYMTAVTDSQYVSGWLMITNDCKF